MNQWNHIDISRWLLTVCKWERMDFVNTKIMKRSWFFFIYSLTFLTIKTPTFWTKLQNEYRTLFESLSVVKIYSADHIIAWFYLSMMILKLIHVGEGGPEVRCNAFRYFRHKHFDSFYLCCLRAWIRNQVSGFLWDVITHPCNNFIGGLAELPPKNRKAESWITRYIC